MKRWLALSSLFLFGSLSAEQEDLSKMHILYLVQSQEISEAFSLYQKYIQELEHHDFELLQQMALLLIEKGARSQDPQRQLTSLFGSHLAGINASIDILEAGVLSQHPQTQVAALQYLGNLQDDRCEELLTKAMSSDYFFTRLEAVHQLALRKSKSAIGQIESLMMKVPPQLHCHFASLFALIGTPEAISILKKMMADPFHHNRIEAILNCARYRRDDLIPTIRKQATHLNAAEQEACAYALGALKDSKSIPTLKSLSNSKTTHIKLSALQSLYLLGDTSARAPIEEMAREKDLFAVCLLANMPGGENTLYALSQSSDMQVRFNAIQALLQRKDERALEGLSEFLIRDCKDLGFQPQFSLGNSLMSWKVTPSTRQHQNQAGYDLTALALSVREHLLKMALDLPESAFLKVASSVFASRQTDLVPLLVHLLENLGSDGATQLLFQESQKAGAPLTRAYCSLALFRLKKDPAHLTATLRWMQQKKQTELVRFRPMLPREMRTFEHSSSLELTPEENSQLLIECYETIARGHEKEGINILIDDLVHGHPQNRPILAGLLIQSIK